MQTIVISMRLAWGVAISMRADQHAKMEFPLWFFYAIVNFVERT